MEINHFEGKGPEWLVHKGTFCFWQRAGLWEEERESTYWCMPAALTLYFLLSFSSNIPLSYIFFSFFSFFLLFFSILVFYSLVFQVPIVVLVSSPIHGNGLFLWCLPWSGFTILTLNYLCLVCVYLLTTTGPSVCHSPSLDKRKLFCLFVCRGTLFCYGVGAFSLLIPHGMHLVVPTQFCFFWVVCHSSKTLPPKEPK